MLGNPKFDHICFGASKETSQNLAKLFTEQFNAPERKPYFFAQEAPFIARQFMFPTDGKLEIICPHSKNSFLHRFLARIPNEKPKVSIHHVTFILPKEMTLKDAADKVRNAGIEVLGFDDRSYPDWQEFFLHPKEGQGIVIQIAKSFEDSEISLPKVKPNNPTATIVGVHINARDRNYTLKLWRDLLGGELSESVDKTDKHVVLSFRWKRRDMNVIVHIDPTLKAENEGPTKVELRNSPVSSESLRNNELGFLFEINNETKSKL